MSKPHTREMTVVRPFYKDGNIRLYTVQVNHMITEFRSLIGGKTKSFKVINYNIIKAFKEFEDYLNGHPLIAGQKLKAKKKKK